MGHFYQYDTRGASPADQILTLERLLSEAEAREEAWRSLALLRAEDIDRRIDDIQVMEEKLKVAEDRIAKMKSALQMCEDAERLRSEGKPVPIMFLRNCIRRALEGL